VPILGGMESFQIQFLDFYEEMDGVNLNGKMAAVFGSYDSAYGNIGLAVDILSEKLLELEADVVLDGLKIEYRQQRKK
jgi:flavodoxin I